RPGRARASGPLRFPRRLELAVGVAVNQNARADPRGPTRACEISSSARLPAVAAAAAATAAAATTAAAPAAAAAARAATAAPAAAAEAAATTARARLVLGLVDADLAPVERLTVHRLDGLAAARIVGERHEAKAPAAAGLAVADDLRLDDRAARIERGLEALAGRGPRQPADEHFLFRQFQTSRPQARPRLKPNGGRGRRPAAIPSSRRARPGRRRSTAGTASRRGRASRRGGRARRS